MGRGRVALTPGVPLTPSQKTQRWAARHPEKHARTVRTNRLRRYGLTPDGFDALLAKQGGCCANLECRAPSSGIVGRSFAVDHDHDTGLVRGLLCNTCNVALGMLGDGKTPNRARGLYQYQLDHAAK